MSEWVDPRIHLATYGGPKQHIVRVQGGKLHGLQVYDIVDRGEVLVWLDNCGELNTLPVLARLKVRLRDVWEISPKVAQVAKVTSSDDPEEELEALSKGNETTTPTWVWLGVQKCSQAKYYSTDPDFPDWANGVEIIECAFSAGDFGPVGYTTPGGEKYFEYAKDYYCELLDCP